jgi:hypothetical protein
LVHGRVYGSGYHGSEGCTRAGMPKTQAFGTWEEGERGLGHPIEDGRDPGDDGPTRPEMPGCQAFRTWEAT